MLQYELFATPLPDPGPGGVAFQRAFLKWAGGKSSILDRILAALPPGRRLVEPFAGSAVVFLNAEYDEYLVADANPDLIGLYQALKEHGASFIDHAKGLFDPRNNTEDAYYLLRERFNVSVDRVERAALFVYLNRHGFNGLCRYNASGKFNVPFGRYRNPRFPADNMRAFAAKAARAELVCDDFRTVLAATGPGDVVYADPPYVPLNATASFTSYSSGGFGAEDQQALAQDAVALARRGVPVLISNHDTAWTRELYYGSRRSYFEVRRSISCKGDERNHVGEVLALFGS
jgi:DNA adenine methylase